MKFPWWLKKAYTDTGTRWLTAFLIIGGPAWSITSYMIDPSPGWWQAWVFFWVFYLIVFIPACYFNRNTK
jgi:hypothetical protein